MYYIGYILGILLIIWLISKLVRAVTGKKDEKTVEGPSPSVHLSAGSSTGSEGSEVMTTAPKKEAEAGSLPFAEVPPEPPEEIYMKAPSDIDLPKTSVYKKEKSTFSEKGTTGKEGPSGTFSSGKEKKTSGPVVRSGTDEPDTADEKKTVILYREDTGKYRKRCPFCNTYLASGNTVCEVCGSRVSA